MFTLSHPQNKLRHTITKAYSLDEQQAVNELISIAQLTPEERQHAAQLSKELMLTLRAERHKQGGVDALMQEFSLSSEEGVALMCLAEALLRVPDKYTRDKLIQDKLSGGDWKSHLHNSSSLFVNAAAWGLLVTGKLVDSNDEKSLSMALTRVMGRGGQPLIRKSVDYAMRILGKQFVTGQNIDKALENAKSREEKGYTFSFDMLGEAALTQADADRYYQNYINALHIIGKQSSGRDVYQSNGLSIKLSAIHPRYLRSQHQRVMDELLPRLKKLFLLAKEYNLGLNIDAEEASRLDISLDLVTALISDPDLQGFNGIGFIVQAYQKRAPHVLNYLIDIARQHQQHLMIRLVKGAYWDSEIKWAQIEGLSGYPVYTRKVHTDISYLACAKILLDAQDAIYPQFATHNAYSLAAIYQMGQGKKYEFQCLHGMGETLYDKVVGKDKLNKSCRIYAPVGSHETLLAYLVRRLLENGANSSFVNQILDDNISIDELVRCPLDAIEHTQGKMHAGIPLPEDILAQPISPSPRANSKGINFNNEIQLQRLEEGLNHSLKEINAHSLCADEVQHNEPFAVLNPADHRDIVGHSQFIQTDNIEKVIQQAITGQQSWAKVSLNERATMLRSFADMLEDHTPLFIMLAIREAGKTYANAIAEIREAVDFCRYYACEGEDKLLQASPLGTLVAISPWNFPLAIFIGEVTAALMAGNTVIAKPAEQTSLIAYEAIKLLHRAGVPKTALQLVLGAGDVGAALTQSSDINGVIFTGSTEVAKAINYTLAQREDNPVLIAETGGQNAMIVDSTALPEQVCLDVLNSAFDSAGQRCSALRVLCLQEDIADHTIAMIKGAMNELNIGNPQYLDTDIGPVIDSEAQQNLLAHIERMKKVSRHFHQCQLTTEQVENGTFVAPTFFELSDLDQLSHEVFGPILHIIRYKAKDLDKVIDQINSKGYALTHGIHSRIEQTIDYITQRIEAGNIYINRNIVGAVVGVQPFGGHGLSGTGPKAGGPFYLQRLSKIDRWLTPTFTTPNHAEIDNLATINEMLAGMGFSYHEKSALSNTVGEALMCTLNQATVTLPGPTGEHNELSWRAPSMVYIHNGDLAQSFTCFIKLALSGIKCAVSDDHPLALWKEHSQGLIVTINKQAALHISHWLTLTPPTPELKLTLTVAEKIIHLIHVDKVFDLSQVFYEVSVSNNTTASGGNTNLMVAAEG